MIISPCQQGPRTHSRPRGHRGSCLRPAGGGPSPSVEMTLLIPAPGPSRLPGVCWLGENGPVGRGSLKQSRRGVGFTAGGRRVVGGGVIPVRVVEIYPPPAPPPCLLLHPSPPPLWENIRRSGLSSRRVVHGGESVVAGDGLGLNAAVTVEVGGPRPTCSPWGGFLQDPEKRIF